MAEVVSFSSPGSAELSQTLSAGHMLMGVLLAMVGAHTSLDLVEGACISTARKMMVAGQQQTRRVASGGVLTLALAGAAVSLAINCAWTSHALAMLGTRYTSGEQSVNLWYRLAAMAGAALLFAVAVFIVARARRGPLGTQGLDQRYVARGASTSRRRSSSHAKRVSRELRTSWPHAFGELRGPYLLRVLGAGLFFGLGFMFMHAADYAGLRQRAIVSFDLVALGVATGAAWLVGCVVVFLLMHAHGGKNRIAGAVAIGVLVIVLHFVALQATRVNALREGDSLLIGDGEALVKSRPTIVVVAILASLLRFLVMGAVSTELS